MVLNQVEYSFLISSHIFFSTLTWRNVSRRRVDPTSVLPVGLEDEGVRTRSVLPEKQEATVGRGSASVLLEPPLASSHSFMSQLLWTLEPPAADALWTVH